MNDINRFRVWDKQKNEMYPCNVSKNNFLFDCCGNLFEIVQTGKNEHLDDKTIRLIPMYIAKERYVIMRLSVCNDAHSRGIFEGDIIRYPSGCEYVVMFGTHPAHCFGNRTDSTNEGFYAAAYENGKIIDNDTYTLSDLGNLEFVVGNIFQGYYLHYKIEKGQ